MTNALSVNDDVFQDAVRALDFEAVARQFRAQDEFVFIERFLPESLVARLVEEAESFLPRGVHRAWVPWVRKAGAVGQGEIARSAPLLHALARSPAILDLARRLSGADLSYKSPKDAHAAALYYYQRKGDHVAWHLDECGCEPNASYTANIGLTNNTESRVVYRLAPGDPGRMKELALRMTPGSVAFFCGSKPLHRVEPLGAGEDRIAFSLTFQRAGRRMGRVERFLYNAWDGLAYFGPRALLQNNYR